MTKNVLQMLEKTVELYPDKIGFSDEKGGIKYSDILHRAKAIATRINKEGVNKEAIAILMDKSKEMLVSFLAVMYSGNFYVPIDNEMPNDRIEKIFAVVKPKQADYEKDPDFFRSTFPFCCDYGRR